MTESDSGAPPPVLDAYAFDPVRFPGQAEDEEWPPPNFDFQAPWVHRMPIRFERDDGGEIVMVHVLDHMRMVSDIDSAHVTLDIPVGSRDYRLLRLVPAALRFTPIIKPGDPMPGILRGEPPPPASDDQEKRAWSVIMELLSARTGEAGRALRNAMNRMPPGPHMFERAVAECVGQGFSLDRIAPLAKKLHRLANAHARLIAAEASGPDFVGLERSVTETHRMMLRDRRRSGDLLLNALGKLETAVARPREAVDGIVRMGRMNIDAAISGRDFMAVTQSQERLNQAMTELGVFWQRTATAWQTVEPDRTERKDVESLTRNAIRRLKIDSLYRVPT